MNRVASHRTTLSSGVIRGNIEGDVVRFLGVPYAAAPFGENRFREPQPVVPWTGERDATHFGATAPQSPYPGEFGELLGSSFVPGREVLTANVWAPADAVDAPVLLWIHGGALERGSAALSGYDGSAFARAGVVFVSINYRLGAEGFSVLDGVPLNLALRDVAAALRWLHSEIGAFGGSTSRITAMGESAGGAVVSALLAREDTRSLLAGGIIQSAPLEAATLDKAGQVTRRMAAELGVRTTREDFAAFSPSQLLDARQRMGDGASFFNGPPAFELAIDPSSLPRSPHEVLAEVNVPLLIGTNTDEYRLWLSPKTLKKMGIIALLLGSRALRAGLRTVRAYRADWPHASPGEILGQLATDTVLRRDMTRVARAQPTSTWVYEFAWPSAVRDLRAAHGVELGFVFDRLDDEEAKRLVGDSAPRALAKEMNAAWVSFAGQGTPGWSPFGADRITRVFDEESITVTQRRALSLDMLR